jgi:hypothetical protein
MLSSSQTTLSNRRGRKVRTRLHSQWTTHSKLESHNTIRIPVTDSITAPIERSYIILRCTRTNEMSGWWSAMIEIEGLACVQTRFL